MHCGTYVVYHVPMLELWVQEADGSEDAVAPSPGHVMVTVIVLVTVVAPAGTAGSMTSAVGSLRFRRS